MPDIAAARPVAGQPIETAWGQNVHDAVEGTPTIIFGFGEVNFATFTDGAVVLTHPAMVNVARASITPRLRGLIATTEENTTTSLKVVLRSPTNLTGNQIFDYILVGVLA
jgi:hypothetical protein